MTKEEQEAIEAIEEIKIDNIPIRDYGTFNSRTTYSQKEIEELQYDFDILRNRAIETAFSQYNDDVELLLRYLSKKGYVKKDKEYYYNPLGDDPNYLKKKENKFISKDKIRDKIKELEKAPLVYELTIDILQELLEGE